MDEQESEFLEEDFLYLPVEPEPRHQANEDILLTYKLETKRKVTAIDCKADGFTYNVMTTARLASDAVSLAIRHDGRTENAVFEIKVTLSNGMSLTQRIYGVMTEYGVFINPYLFEIALG